MSRLVFICLMLFAMAASAQTVLFDTFNEEDPDHLFDCCEAQGIEGSQVAQGKEVLAVGFVPAIDTKVIEIDLAASVGSGDPTLHVELHSSVAGLPGRLKHLWRLTNVPEGGQCCRYLSVVDDGVPVKGGQRYWIVVRALGDTDAGWNFSKGHHRGREARFSNGSWGTVKVRLAAVRVIGQ